ncbi:MAG: hypothetical protein IJZ19_01505 [Lentisphaeria bacterium]|nr:hypothetical protein [Lentisphaeria bacterium]
MKRYYFTLTELLVTIGIIIILAGLAIPAVLVAQQKGRVTAAKADMNAILTALKGVEGTYHKMVNTSKKFGDVNGNDSDIYLSKTVNSKEYKYLRLGDKGKADSLKAYNYFILELTSPNKLASGEININRRKITFLDPKSEFDPTADIDLTDAAYVENLWRDPWGNPYVLLISTDFSGVIPNPAVSGKALAANAIAYSFGPDGEDNSGQSTDYDDDDGDDICSWR